MKTRITTTIALLTVIAVACQAPAGVTITKTETAHVKAWNTIFGIRVSTILDVNMSGTLPISESWYATDLDVEQKPVASVSMASHRLAPIIPDGGGGHTMAVMLPWMQANFGEAARTCPDLYPPPDSFFDVFVSIDLNQYLHSGAVPLPDGAVVEIVNGRNPGELPGYEVGLAPIEFDPAVGWANPQPYTGPIMVAGHFDISAEHGGDDCYEALHGEFGFAREPIPPDFFGPGSDPFDGIIAVRGGDPAGPDTIVRRLEPAVLPDPPPSTDTVPIELVELSLVSTEPITVTYQGASPEPWDVSVALQEMPAPVGHMAITKEHLNGGTFTSDLYVQPLFTFTRPDGVTRQLNTSPIHATHVQPYPWQDTPTKANTRCDGRGVYPSGTYPLLVESDVPGRMILELEPPRPVSPYIALDTEDQWGAALGERIVPLSELEWQDYMQQWDTFTEPGLEPYPDNTFVPAELYVWEGSDCPGENEEAEPSSAGLVMVWGNEQMADNFYSSAWKYQYPADPDLSNVTITITVLPPCGINVVSFGMRDINGNIRAWYWNVGAAAGPGMLACGTPTTININTALTGTGAASPAAASYMNNPGFDIKQVQDLIVDEDWAWIGGAVPPPPPGQTIPRMWNYWYDLLITPNQQQKPDNPIKWSQPPEEIAPHVFLGWDEMSVRPWQPLMADDWMCEDQRPVTDIHWWGSHLGWAEPEPPQMPIAFHIGIWTDVPKNADDPASFSHPGEMIWQHVCNNYVWNFAGYDKDPRYADPTDPVDATGTTVDTTVINPAVQDSCFQYYCVLPQSNWFYQKPSENGTGQVYWLSIAAIYGPDQPDPMYPWGWKTRPHFFNDDAVRIYNTQDGTWPPFVGSKWLDGKPVEFPEHVSWDLAFELTTDRPEPVQPSPDINLDGIVNYLDVAILANWWLTAGP